MADSNITKKALAAALKELMTEKPFEKINVADICEKCDMNRKSFYYHFKDKYDLVNWIFDTEFITIVSKEMYYNTWDFMQELCSYFYANKNFYRKVLQIKGQNCFADHFRDFLVPMISAHLKEIFENQKEIDFFVVFFADAYISTLERWILDRNCIPPEELVGLLKACVVGVAGKVSREIQVNGEYPG